MSCARMMAAISTPGLTPIAKLIYATLMGWANDTGAAKASFTALAAFLSCNRESAIVAIGKLTELGLISIKSEGHGHEPNLYQVTKYHEGVGKSDHKRSRKIRLVGNSDQLEIPTTTRPKQPVSEPVAASGPRARVDSDSSLKEEGSKKGRERAKALSTRAGARENEPQGFAEFYLAYPRKVGRPGAVKAFAKALNRGASKEGILDGLRRYRFSADPQFRPHPATWLNDERWKDGVEAPAQRSINPCRMASYL